MIEAFVVFFVTLVSFYFIKKGKWYQAAKVPTIFTWMFYIALVSMFIVVAFGWEYTNWKNLDNQIYYGFAAIVGSMLIFSFSFMFGILTVMLLACLFSLAVSIWLIYMLRAEYAPLVTTSVAMAYFVYIAWFVKFLCDKLKVGFFGQYTGGEIEPEVNLPTISDSEDTT